MSKILIVDDEPQIVEIIKQALSVYIPGSIILTESTGINTISLVLDERPDLILLDIILPRISGLELCQQIKSDPETKHIPVILMTGLKTDRQLKIKSLSLGADGFLVKPFDLAEVAAQVKAMLRLKLAEDALKKERDELKNMVAKQALTISDIELRWQMVLEAGNDGIWDWDVKSNSMFLSSSWRRTLQQPEDKAYRIVDMFRLINGDDRARLRKTLSGYLSRRIENFQVQMRMMCGNGQYRWMLYRGVAVWDENGLPVRMIGVQTDINEQKEMELRLQDMAHHDTLTGLPNRVLLYDRAQQLLAQARRKKSLIAFLFIDLDKFKPVNDNYGHDVGDLLLRTVAKRLLGAMRMIDTVARIGGDEFVIMLPDIKSPKHVNPIAIRVLELLHRPFAIKQHRVEISGSVGISFYPRDGESVEELIKFADEAMYRAKQGGRAAYCYYNNEIEKSD